MNRSLSILLFAGLSVLSRAGSVSTDFSQPLDSDWQIEQPIYSSWEVDTPNGPQTVYDMWSRYTQDANGITLINRATLATAAAFSAPYTFSATFTMLDDIEHFNIALRTDLNTPGNPFYERDGLLVSFSNDGDSISIQGYTDENNWDILGIAGFNLSTGEKYDVAITDDGFNVGVSINGIDILDVSNPFATGDRIALYSREFGMGTLIEDVSITEPQPQFFQARMASVDESPSVPDAFSTLILLGGSLGLMIFFRRIY